MKPIYEEIQKLRDTVSPALGSRVGNLYFDSRVLEFTEKIAIEFAKWRRSREFEINCLEQRTHSDAELFNYFKQEF